MSSGKKRTPPTSTRTPKRSPSAPAASGKVAPVAEELLANLKANLQRSAEIDRERFERSLLVELPSDLVKLDPRLTLDGKFVDPEE